MFTAVHQSPFLHVYVRPTPGGPPIVPPPPATAR